MKPTTQGAKRLVGFNKPTVWTVMTPLAIKTNSINLGQGFPSWGPPDFYKKYLEEAAKNSNHQYVRAYGSLTYTKAIAEFHKPTFGHIDHENEICIVSGGVEGLFCSIIGLVNPGEEVITFDPSYDCYRPQVQMAGGKTVGIPLIPRKSQTKEELIKKIENGVISDDNDEWDIDFPNFEKALNEKTKVVIVNSPHNPVGKVFTEEEMAKMAKILQKWPQIVVIEDNVYEGMTFDKYFKKPLPKMTFQEGMRDRCISVYSAGKIFSATGMRSGWIIGPAHLIQAARSVHQFNVYCFYNVVENVATKSLQHITEPGNDFMEHEATRLRNSRDVMIRQFLKADIDYSFWIPKGGCFVLADIEKIKVKEQYWHDEKGNKLTKDYAFANQLVNENKVVCIPMSSFYDAGDSHLGERFVRFAFCKDEDIIREAAKRLQKK